MAPEWWAVPGMIISAKQLAEDALMDSRYDVPSGTFAGAWAHRAKAREPQLARAVLDLSAENERLKAALREACDLLTDYTLLPGDAARAAELAKLAEKP